ncbi:hypothetical protein BX600DRAFT_109902 [Xylariales sp. PMI_506]|nr:hypothetical protein BX600DRAFT_109902 [Xylariales sp. PMI_506]
MDNKHIISVVQRGFVDVAEAVDEYKLAKPDRESRGLARRLSNEEALFDQSMRKLSQAASFPSIYHDDPLKTIEETLGPTNAEWLKKDLRQLFQLLNALKIDLANTSRGTEVLAKLKRTKVTTFRRVVPKTQLQEHLDEISRINRRLDTYLIDGRVLLPRGLELHGTLEFRLLQLQQRGKSVEGFQIEGPHRVCNCDQAAYSRLQGLGMTSPMSPGATGGPLWQQTYEGIYASARSLRPDEEGSLMNQNMSPNSNRKQRDGSRHRHSDSFKEDHKLFLLFIKERAADRKVITIEELIQRPDDVVDRRLRMILASRLAFAVILLWTSRPLQSWQKSGRWLAYFDETQRLPYSTFFLSPPDGDKPGSDAWSEQSPDWFSLVNKEPVLARLGLRLIELVMGQTLAELRQEHFKASADGDDEESDSELLDLLTAKKLLAYHRIRHEVSRAFEGVVAACIEQQYREFKSGDIKELSFEDPLFLKNATAAILLPLYQETGKLTGCDCMSTDDDSDKGVEAGQEPSQNIQVQESNNVDALLPAFSKDHSGADLQAPADIESFRNPSSIRERMLDGSIDKPVAPSYPPSSGSASDGEGELQSNNRLHQQTTNPLPKLDRANINVDSPVASNMPNQFDVLTSNTNSRPEKSQSQPRIQPELPLAHKVTHSPSGPPWKAGNNSVEQRIPLRPLVSPIEDYSISESNFSYETFTATTEQSVASPPDPPRLPDDHPFSKASDAAIRILMRGFQQWNQCGTGTSEVSGSASREGVSKKRGRTQPTRSNNEEDDDEEEGGTPQPSPSVSRKRARKEESLTFACPYLKMDAMAHNRCCKYTLTRIRDVKQHLSRCHQLPVYCPRCFETFKDEEQRDNHAQFVDCPKRAHLKPEGITNAQRKLLEKKPPKNQTPEQQWYTVYEILFPDHPRPQSPYVDTTLLQNVVNYQSFVRTDGPRIIRDILSARGAVEWNLPNEAADREAFQFRMLEEGIQEIFNQWTRRGGLEIAEFDAANTSSRSLSANNDHITPGPSSTSGTNEYENEQHPMVTTSTNFTLAPVTEFPTAMSWSGSEDFGIASVSLENDNGIDPMTSTDAEELRTIFDNYSWPGHLRF